MSWSGVDRWRILAFDERHDVYFAASLRREQSMTSSSGLHNPHRQFNVGSPLGQGSERLGQIISTFAVKPRTDKQQPKCSFTTVITIDEKTFLCPVELPA